MNSTSFKYIIRYSSTRVLGYTTVLSITCAAGTIVGNFGQLHVLFLENVLTQFELNLDQVGLLQNSQVRSYQYDPS